jgi:hypothetical protein
MTNAYTVSLGAGSLYCMYTERKYFIFLSDELVLRVYNSPETGSDGIEIAGILEVVMNTKFV